MFDSFQVFLLLGITNDKKLTVIFLYITVFLLFFFFSLLQVY